MIVKYLQSEWDRASAWENLHNSLIVGAPKVWSEEYQVWLHGWRKVHGRPQFWQKYWAWEYK